VSARWPSSARRTAATVLGAVAFGAACTGGDTAPAPAPTIDVPAGWSTVSASDGSLQLTLPPWLILFDNVNAIFANEPPPGPGEEIPMQLMAMGPQADGQPKPGEDLVRWLEGRLADPGQGVPAVTRIELPAGPTVRFDRTDRAGTPTAWRLLAFAIQRPEGVAYLQIDGPPDAWPARLADIELLVQLFRVR
jgi:hypothetical protein